MKSNPIPATLFVRNRAKLVGLMASGSIAIVRSNDRVLRNGDQFYPYRQRSDFFYLTGINQEESVLVLFSHHPDPTLEEVLFIKKPTLKSDLWTGPVLSSKEGEALSGISQVKWLDELDTFLGLVLPGASLIYSDQKIGPERTFRLNQLSALITQLRMVKEFEEIEVIKKAAAITRSAFMKVLKMLVPGVWEYQVEAEIIGEFINQGAEGHGYEPIVASGKNALILHYLQNNKQCNKGELLLLDFGAEVNNYCADCSRSVPVSGRFSKRQRELYEAVLRVFKQARKMMVPGILIAEFHNNVGELWEREHIGLGLYSLKDIKAHKAQEPLWKDYFVHGTTHSLGLDVHDPFDRSQTFQAGMVLTCEPAIYIPEEGIGIRLENDILITNEGPVDLLQEIPIEVDEIEDLLNYPR